MIQPGGTLGLLGGGQLGRMFTQRARGMGYEVAVLEPDPASPAGAVATKHLVAAYDDPVGLSELASLATVVTTEFENVPAAALDWLASRVICRPSGRAVATAQDRIAEKTFVREAGLSTADFDPIHDADDLARAWERIGGPALLKTSRLGYDGKGQATITSLAEAVAAFERFGRVACVYERKLALERELSVVLARDARGAVACFPVGENVHLAGVLHTTVAPAPIAESLRQAAVTAATTVATALGYVGVLGVELFVSGGSIFVNEIAPRPHNSGHYTMDACSVDQFEQQVRICADLPLGQPRLLSPVCMINLLGDAWAGGEPDWANALALPGVRLHLYGKKQVRPGRKMGHLNCLATTPSEALALADEAFRRLTARS